MGPKKKLREQQPVGSTLSSKQLLWCADVISVVAEFLPPTDQYQKPLMLVSKLWLEGVAQQQGMKVLRAVHWPFAALRHRGSQKLYWYSTSAVSTADLEELVENLSSSQISSLALWEMDSAIDMTCLSRMETLTALRFWTQAVDVPRGLNALTSLKTLFVENLSDTDCKTISALTSLDHLQIICKPPISVEAVSHLARLRMLTRLSLVVDLSSDEHMKVIGQMTQLSELSLCFGNECTDAGMESLSKLLNLTNLKLWNDNHSITGKGLRLLGKLKKLTHFRVNCEGCNTISNEDLVFFHELQELQSFELDLDDSFTLTDDGLEHITGAKCLKRLDLSNWTCGMTAAGAKHIERLSQLTSLHFGAFPAPTESGLVSLASLVQLEHLEISCGVTAAEFCVLTTFKKLKRLRVEVKDVVEGDSACIRELIALDGQDSCLEDVRVTKCSDAVLQRISLIRSLTVLHVEDSASVTDDGVQHLSSLVNLEKLSMSKLAITGSGFRGFGNKLRKLRELTLQECDNLQDHGMHHVCEITSLRSLMVKNCTSFTDDAYSPIAKLRNVTCLRILECAGIQCEGGFTEIAWMRSLETLWLIDCDISREFLRSLRSNESLESLNVWFSSSWKGSRRFSKNDVEELVEHKQGAWLRHHFV